MKSSDVSADILFYLQDGKKHTYSQLAELVECSISTIKRHIQSLSYKNLNIEIIHGGFGGGGVRLIPDENIKTNYLNLDELQLIMSKLESLQDSSTNIKKFVKSIAPLIEKRRNTLWNQIKN